MALIKCAKCGKETNDKRDKCLYCGQALSKPSEEELLNLEIVKLRKEFEDNLSLIFLKDGETYMPYFSEPKPMTGVALNNLIEISMSQYIIISTLARIKREKKEKGYVMKMGYDGNLREIESIIYDWEAIKQTVKLYDRKTESDRNAFAMNLEAICFNRFEFGILSKETAFKLGQFYMGKINESDLDESFRDEWRRRSAYGVFFPVFTR